MDSMIKHLKEKLSNSDLQDATERDLSNKITLWLLEEWLGYKRENMHWEAILPSKIQNKFIDIFIDLGQGNTIIIETKKFNCVLGIDDLQQLNDYLERKKSDWGILTNGKVYYLINRSISTGNLGKKKRGIEEKVVLKIEIGEGRKKGKNEKYLKYLSKESIFERKVTNFYRDIAIFFSGHELSDESKKKYQNTLYNFFDFYIDKGNNYFESNNGVAVSLEEISERDVIDFLKADRPAGRPYSGQVPKAKCAHINTMFAVLTEMRYIKMNKMAYLLERVTSEFDSDFKNIQVDQNLLTSNVVEKILNILEEKKKPAKVLIFILCAYYGFDRNRITNFFALQWNEAVDFDKKVFILDGIKYPMVKKLYDTLMQIKNNYKEKGVSAKAVYVSRKGNKYCPVKELVINSLFSEDIQKISDDTVDWKSFTAQSVRAMLIYNMCENGCSLEGISYLTGATPSQILRYVTEDILKINGEKYWNKTRKMDLFYHPYKNIFDE